MKIIRNDALIKRNAKISQYILYAALISLVLGIYFTFKYRTPEKIGWAYLSLIISYILVQTATTMGNRWSRSPRPDEVLAQSLKGLGNEFSLYIFTTAVPYLLIGPAGIWILKTYFQPGTIYVDEKKNVLKQKKSGNFFTKIFSAGGIGNVLRESEDLKKQLEKYFQKCGITNHPDFKTICVFLHPDVEIKVSKFAEPVVSATKLKDFMRRAEKQINLPAEKIEKITSKLPVP